MSDNNKRRKFTLIGITSGMLASTVVMDARFKQAALHREIRAFAESNGINGDRLLKELQNCALTGQDNLETIFHQIKEAVSFERLDEGPLLQPTLTKEMIDFKIPEPTKFVDYKPFNGYMGKRRKR